jgi:hypothetical protein
MLIKSYMLINLCYAFEPHEPYVTLLSTRCTYACLFFYLDKNPGWVTDGASSDYFYFSEDY